MTSPHTSDQCPRVDSLVGGGGGGGAFTIHEILKLSSHLQLHVFK